MTVTCKHCGARITPKRRRSHGPAHWLLLLGIVAAGAFWSPWALAAAWIPVAIPSRYHVCPACGLKLD